MTIATLSCPVCLHSHYNLLHTAARLIKYLSPKDHITPTLKQLHWLPIDACIAFKISLFMHHIYSGTSTSYMSSMVTLCSAPMSRSLRSSTCGDFANSHKSAVWQSCFLCRRTQRIQ